MSRLSRLLQPKSIAVIGGGVWCANIIHELEKIGFAGPVWRVHPRDGFASVEELPDAPDAAFVGVNREATIDVVAALKARGAGGAICFASGFAEAAAELEGAGDLQSSLLEAAGEMPILGPNCYGLLNYLDRVALWPDQHGGAAQDSGVAIVTQSSNIAINLTMQARGVPIAYAVTAGNQAMLGLSDIGRALLDDPRVTALGFHIEGLDDPAAFYEMARAADAAGKPIIALKVGASEQAQLAAVSHTASMAGSDSGARAFLRHCGVAQVDTLDGFLEALKLAHVHGRLEAAQVASMSCSGGEASLMADLGAAYGVGFPALRGGQAAALRQALGPKVALANPLDYHTYIWGDEAAMTDAFSAMMTEDHALGLLVIDTPRADRCDPSAWEPAFRAVSAAQKRSGRPMGILASLPETLPEDVADRLTAQGIVPLAGMGASFEAIAALSGPGAQTAPPLAPRQDTGAVVVAEPEAKAALRAHGLDVPGARQCLVSQAGAAATEIGFPVVLKSVGQAHKSEHGGVVLGIKSPEDAQAAAVGMGTEKVYVEEMVPGAVAELLIAVRSDPAHGMILTLGRGGTETELHQDLWHGAMPLTAPAIEAGLKSLKCAPLLAGYRGKPSADMAGIVSAVLAVQDFVMAAPDIVELEINPALCLPERCVVADALMRKVPK